MNKHHYATTETYMPGPDGRPTGFGELLTDISLEHSSQHLPISSSAPPTTGSAAGVIAARVLAVLVLVTPQRQSPASPSVAQSRSESGRGPAIARTCSARLRPSRRLRSSRRRRARCLARTPFNRSLFDGGGNSCPARSYRRSGTITDSCRLDRAYSLGGTTGAGASTLAQ
jgi:hypothetical protein